MEQSTRMNIVFDLGAVVIGWEPARLLQTRFPERAPDPEAASGLARAFFHHPDWQDFDRGVRGDEGISRDASLVQSDDDAGMRWRRLLHCSVEGGARGERGGMGEMGHDVDKEKRLVPSDGETALFGSCSHCRERPGHYKTVHWAHDVPLAGYETWASIPVSVVLQAQGFTASYGSACWVAVACRVRKSSFGECGG